MTATTEATTGPNPIDGAGALSTPTAIALAAVPGGSDFAAQSTWWTDAPKVNAIAERAAARLLAYAGSEGLAMIDVRAMSVLGSFVTGRSDREVATVTRAVVAAVDWAITTMPYRPDGAR